MAPKFPNRRKKSAGNFRGIGGATALKAHAQCAIFSPQGRKGKTPRSSAMPIRFFKSALLSILPKGGALSTPFSVTSPAFFRPPFRKRAFCVGRKRSGGGQIRPEKRPAGLAVRSGRRRRKPPFAISDKINGKIQGDFRNPFMQKRPPKSCGILQSGFFAKKRVRESFALRRIFSKLAGGI